MFGIDKKIFLDCRAYVGMEDRNGWLVGYEEAERSTVNLTVEGSVHITSQWPMGDLLHSPESSPINREYTL